MLNAKMENKTIFLLIFRSSEIIIAEYGVCDHDLRKEIKILVKPFLFSIILYNMKLLAILQVKQVKL